MNNYLKKHPDKHFINNISDALYPTFTNRALSIGPMYINFNGYTSGLYPFDEIFYYHIKTDKPLVLVQKDTRQYIKGYYELWRSDRHKGIILMAQREK